MIVCELHKMVRCGRRRRTFPSPDFIWILRRLILLPVSKLASFINGRYVVPIPLTSRLSVASHNRTWFESARWVVPLDPRARGGFYKATEAAGEALNGIWLLHMYEPTWIWMPEPAKLHSPHTLRYLSRPVTSVIRSAAIRNEIIDK